MSLTLSSYTTSSAVLGTLKKSDAIFEVWREDDDCVPEAMVSKGFREKILQLELQEADTRDKQLIVAFRFVMYQGVYLHDSVYTVGNCREIRSTMILLRRSGAVGSHAGDRKFGTRQDVSCRAG